ncbi:MAG: protoheme IX farnesyltransferase [Betaproteobacteria bacterium RBG_16_58_11]|nr:MAG: protoheme IX farnesyltransferase [Betaproteobacteria bacterium RBG_16_58_11]
MGALTTQLLNVFKLRIGVVIAFTALTGLALTPGPHVPIWKIALIGLAVLLSAAAAGAFNQYIERDLDIKMARTQRRPFVTGAMAHGPAWLWLIGAMVAGSTLAAAWAINVVAALYVFLGAFFYAVVYTVWLKRRTWLNIVVGGLAGSFAVLAGAATVTPQLDPLPLSLALVLFLWTPPHFWSLAIAYHDDYSAAGVPMLPVVIGKAAAARVILGNTVLLVAASLLPVWFGAGPVYLAGALIGGAYFLAKSIRLAKEPSRANAMVNFHASLLQLTLLLTAAIVDAVWWR